MRTKSRKKAVTELRRVSAGLQRERMASRIDREIVDALIADVLDWMAESLEDTTENEAAWYAAEIAATWRRICEEDNAR